MAKTCADSEFSQPLPELSIFGWLWMILWNFIRRE